MFGKSKKKEEKESLPKVAAFEIEKDCDLSGYLTKQGGSVKSWHKRYVILHQGTLYYYKTKKDGAPRGLIKVTGLRCERAQLDHKKHAIKIISELRTYYATCDTEADAEAWLKAINESSSYQAKQLVHVVASEQCEDPDAKYRTIEAALHSKDLTNNDIIGVRPAEYHVSKPLVLREAIEIRGAHADRAMTFVCSTPELKSEPIFNVIGKEPLPDQSNQVNTAIKIAQFTLNNTSAPCITVTQGTCIIENCSLTSMENTAIVISNNSKCIISKCVISHNGQAAILVKDTAQVTIKDCEIAGNQIGIVIQDFAFCHLEHSKLLKMREHALAVESKVVPHVKANKFANNMIGPVRLKEGCSVELTSNELE